MNCTHIRFLWVLLILIFGSTLIAQYPGYSFRPKVINKHRTEPIYFEYELHASYTHVIFRTEQEEFLMYDDGTRGDRVAGDRIFTVELDPQDFIREMRFEDAFRPHVGTVHPYINNYSPHFSGIRAPVRVDVMPDVPVARFNEELQASPRILNIKSDEYLEYNEIYRLLEAQGIQGEADFMNILVLPSRGGLPGYISLRNDVVGLGQPKYDFVYDDAVPDRLKGVFNVLRTSIFDGASRRIVRGYTSQWLPHLGYPFSACEQWAVSDLARSIIGYDRDGYPQCMSEEMDYVMVPMGDDIFKLQYDAQDFLTFNSLELYLMGLIPPEEVEEFAVFDDQEAARIALQTNPNRYEAAGTIYGIEDVTQKVGERVPAFGEAQTTFQVISVIISPELLTREELAYYDFMAWRGEVPNAVPTVSGYLEELGFPFESATRGKGRMSWLIDGVEFPELSITSTLCHGDIYVLDDKEYTEPGEYVQLIQNEDGHDTLAYLTLDWHPEDVTEMYVEMCPGEEYLLGDQVLTTSGLYEDVEINQFGCDSTTFLTLEVDFRIEGGRISTVGNQSQYHTICVGDGLPDMFKFINTSKSNYAYILADRYDMVLDILNDDTINFENRGIDAELVWGVSYSGELLVMPGDDLHNTVLSDKCYDLSDNFVEIHKQTEGSTCILYEERPYTQDIELTVAPNPAVDVVNITIPINGLQRITSNVQIINMNGQIVSERRVELAPGINIERFNVVNFAPGLYLVNLQENMKHTRFVKL